LYLYYKLFSDESNSLLPSLFFLFKRDYNVNSEIFVTL
jgi:hypothetical protein